MRHFVLLAAIAYLAAGCSSGEEKSAAGPAANSTKSFSKAEADKAQPVRGAKGGN